MTPAAVTADLVHQLVAGSHAEGVTDLAVACIIDLDDRVLLIVEPGLDFIDDTWQLPAGPVLPGETLIDALVKVLAAVDLAIDEITGYLGHDDHLDTDGEITRRFCFTVTVTDPHSICRSARIGHWWIDVGDLPDLPSPTRPNRTSLLSWAWATRPQPDPPPTRPLRACPFDAAEAGTELLIRHATWLHRSDFRDRFPRTGTRGTEIAAIDWAAAITALDTGGLPCSGSEGRMLRLAASLADGIPVNLRDALIGLDSRNLGLVSHAILHAAGNRPLQITY